MIINNSFELFFSKELALEHINRIVTIKELDNRTVTITHRHVILHVQCFQVLDQATLQVPTTTGLYSCIN